MCCSFWPARKRNISSYIMEPNPHAQFQSPCRTLWLEPYRCEAARREEADAALAARKASNRRCGVAAWRREVTVWRCKSSSTNSSCTVSSNSAVGFFPLSRLPLSRPLLSRHRQRCGSRARCCCLFLAGFLPRFGVVGDLWQWDWVGLG
jgi:hypothetical protein